jgi:hypothetical protein
MCLFLPIESTVVTLHDTEQRPLGAVTIQEPRPVRSNSAAGQMHHNKHCISVTQTSPAILSAVFGSPTLPEVWVRLKVQEVAMVQPIVTKQLSARDD